MAITMAQLATRYIKAAEKVQPVSDQKIRTIAQLAVGLVKGEIQGMHAVDTSTMLNSTQAEKVSAAKYLIGPTVFYAPYVALGTSRMAARPFHTAATSKLQPLVTEVLNSDDLGL